MSIRRIFNAHIICKAGATTLGVQEVLARASINR